ncbi:MAG: hypothetical protein SH819_09300 [Cytophagales bacterium]|nr:hypothetical protein [Cytophagales bacterium]
MIAFANIKLFGGKAFEDIEVELRAKNCHSFRIATNQPFKSIRSIQSSFEKGLELNLYFENNKLNSGSVTLMVETIRDSEHKQLMEVAFRGGIKIGRYDWGKVFIEQDKNGSWMLGFKFS